jgi:hypothetical protein
VAVLTGVLLFQLLAMQLGGLQAVELTSASGENNTEEGTVEKKVVESHHQVIVFCFQ